VDGNCSVDNALQEYAKLMPRMVVENLKHGSRADHARVHAAFSPDRESEPDPDLANVDLHALNDGWSDNPEVGSSNPEMDLD
jgi:hypothetical protein